MSDIPEPEGDEVGERKLIYRKEVPAVCSFPGWDIPKLTVFSLLLLDTGEGREKERKRNIYWLPLACALTGDGTCNPGMCSDWESNQRLSLCRMVPNQLSHTGQGTPGILKDPLIFPC